MSKLYSYRCVCGDREEVCEYLTDHSARVVKHLRRVKGSKLHKYAVIKGGVDSEGFINALITAGALHDVGKAFYQFSERVDGRGCKYLTFAGHEWISAYLILKLMRVVSVDETPAASLLDATFYAVLLHHHAMNAVERRQVIVFKVRPPQKSEVLEGLMELSDLIPDDSIRNAYPEVIEGVAGRVIDGGSEGLAAMVESVRQEYLNLLKRSWSARGRRILYLVATAALVTADYLAAGEVRGPSRSRFWGVVKEFSNTYFRGA